MNKQYQKNAVKKMIFAWMSIVLGSLLMIRPVLYLIGNIPVGKFFILLGFIMFILACMDIASSRGYHRGWGFLGIFNVVGLCVLYVFPDKDSLPKNPIK